MEAFLPAKEVDCVIAMAGDGQDRRQQIEIGHWYDIVLILGFCSLFWATGWMGMILLVAITYLIEILIDNITARMNWRWMLGYVWAMGLTLSIVNLIWINQT